MSIDPNPNPQTIVPEDLSRELFLSRVPRVNGRPLLGGIALLRKVGRGGMGAVYFGIHPRLDCPVAVKILSLDLAEQDPSLAQRFLAEARMAAGLRSPHVVQMFDVNVEHETHFYVMEFIDGESAGGYLKRVRGAGRPGLEEAEVLEIVKAATRGLADAHAAGIVHRDIKPDNLLIPRVGDKLDFSRTKILDLGLAKPAGTGSSLGTLANVAMGTPGFMAPEQARDARTAGKPADVFSMGATLYALLSGKSPFGGSSVMTTLADTETKPHQPLHAMRPDVSAATQMIIERCLAKDPAARYADAAMLLDSLSGGGVSEPTLISATVMNGSTVGTPRGKHSIVWVAALIVALLAGMAAVYFNKPGPGPSGDPIAEARATAEKDLRKAIEIVDRYLLVNGDSAQAPDARKLREHWALILETRTTVDNSLKEAAEYDRDGKFAQAVDVLVEASKLVRADPSIMDALNRAKKKLRDSKTDEQRKEEVRRMLAVADGLRTDAGEKPEAWQKVVNEATKAQAIADGAEKEAATSMIAEAMQHRDELLARQAEKEGKLAKAIELAKAAVGYRPSAALADYLKALEDRQRTIHDRVARKKEFDAWAEKARKAADAEIAAAAWDHAGTFADAPEDRAMAQAGHDAAIEKVQNLKRTQMVLASLEGAEKAFADENYDAAEMQFRAALDLIPDEPNALAGLQRVRDARTPHDIEVKLRTEDEAILKAIEIDPMSFTAANNLYDKCLTLHERDHSYDLAIGGFKRVYYTFPYAIKGPAAAYHVAKGYAATNDRERALNWLEVCFRAGWAQVEQTLVDEDFKALRGDKRYEDILRRAAMVLRTVEAKRRKEDQPLINEGLPKAQAEVTKLFATAYDKLTKEARYEEATRIFKKIFYAFPDTADGRNAAYNVACGYSLRGEKSAALDWLEISVAHGLMHNSDTCHGSMALHARADTDFKELWKDERFDRIVMGGVRPFSDCWGGYEVGTWIQFKETWRKDEEVYALRDRDDENAKLEIARGERTRRRLILPRKAEAYGEARVTVGKQVFDCRKESLVLLNEKVQIWTVRDGPEAELAAAQIQGADTTFVAKSFRRDTFKIGTQEFPSVVVEYEATRAGAKVVLVVWFCRHLPGSIARLSIKEGNEEERSAEAVAWGVEGSEARLVDQMLGDVASRYQDAATFTWKAKREVVETKTGVKKEFTVDIEGKFKGADKVLWTQASTDEESVYTLVSDGKTWAVRGVVQDAEVAGHVSLYRKLLVFAGTIPEFLPIPGPDTDLDSGLLPEDLESVEGDVDGKACVMFIYKMMCEGVTYHQTLWVDDATNTILRRSISVMGEEYDATITETFTEQKFDAAIDDAVFKVPAQK